MTSTQPTVQRAPSATSQRKKLAAEAARKPKVVYPTTLQPDALDRVPTMSIADSALLQATLTQSRHTWTHTAFTRFIPEPPARGAGGKKYASELTPVGSSTVCIGPHMFLDTKFFAVFNPSPPPPPSFTPSQPASNASTPSSTAPTTPTVGSPQSSSLVATLIPGSTPIPERVIDSIKAQLSDDAVVEGAAIVATPDMSMDVDTDTPSGSIAGTVTNVEVEQGVTALSSTSTAPTKDEQSSNVQLKAEPVEKPRTPSRPTTPTSTGTKVRVPSSRPQRPKHQVAFEFRENPGVRWLFPHESSLELANSESGEAVKIFASFWLPTMEEARPSTAAGGTVSGPGSTSIPTMVPGPGQATTVVILQASMELWEGLQQSISDPATTYRHMMEKMKHIPPRVYVQYNLPIDFPDEQLHLMGFKKLPDHHVVPLTTLEPPKRKADAAMEQQAAAAAAKAKKAKADEALATSAKAGANSKKNTGAVNAPTSTSTNSSGQKQCAYCGVTSTPTWRRGPGGPHTLCNACGVKWRQGKIFIDPADKTAPVKARPPAPSPTPAPAPAPVPKPPPTPSTPTVIPTTTSSVPVMPSESLTTTAEAAARMHQGSLKVGSDEADRILQDQEMDARPVSKTSVRRNATGSKKQGQSTAGENASKTTDGEKASAGRKRGANKATTPVAAGPKMVPITQIGEPSKLAVKSAANTKKEKEKGKEKEKTKTKDSAAQKEKAKALDKGATGASESAKPAAGTAGSSTSDSSLKDASARISATASPIASSASNTPTSVSSASSTKSATTTTPKVAAAKATHNKTDTPTASKAATKAKPAAAGAITPSATTAKTPSPTTAAAKLSLLKSLASSVPRYQVSHPPAVATSSVADGGLSLYATKNLYTNNTATFPLHFPTISIAFGPNNAYYMYPNCAVVLFENHFQIKLIHAGERTDIDVWKEGIEGTEFQVVDVGDGESMIIMRAVLRQQLARFDKELLNPDKNEISIVFRFRERLDGGGPPVKPLLEHWLATEIPVAVPPGAKSATTATGVALTGTGLSHPPPP
ncbi:hypothetical protein EDD11_008241 [Mortierella claussenii]|nr:hypothetical protein EDD11_008241 [Mortierella claussenii]